ncbi:cold shock and DUF1294 domain-containing protein [Rhodoferax sp. GW822-FHT02A01]|uniref:cold shock and DUF1294 domain-containing protein n=1 Tax=Rhodoferax sp. GW822-FHT02A01 TaxID=3141537 RepID=UPI00315D2A3D
MRFEGVLTYWNEERGFGRIDSMQGGEPIFVHVSAWPKGVGRPTPNQAVTFEVEMSPKGKRARNVHLIRPRRLSVPRQRDSSAQWGTASLFAIPAFLLLYAALSYLWRLPLWVAGIYVGLSAATFIAYAVDKSAAARGNWRTPESTLHLLSLSGGWPGALLAQQLLRHKSSKREFRLVFWGTFTLNIIGLVSLASPLVRKVLAGV